MSQSESELIEVSRQLSNRVGTFNNRLTAMETLNRRTRLLALASIAFGFFLVLGLIFALNTVHQSKVNLYTNCTNANESRQAQRELWDFVLGSELSDTSKNQNPAEVAMSEKILPWIHKVYANRDCHNLHKKYPLPSAPTLPTKE